MTNKGKMLAGQVYDPNDKELVSEQFEYLNAMKAYNALPYGDKREEEYLRKCFGAIGKQSVVTQPFFANWGGKHVFIGDYFYSNFNLTLVDDGKIEIGDNVMIGPNVSIITAGHPVSPKCRLKGLQYNADVKIGNNVWIGAGVNVLPGVTIGDNSVIGAGRSSPKIFRPTSSLSETRRASFAKYPKKTKSITSKIKSFKEKFIRRNLCRTKKKICMQNNSRVCCSVRP